MLLSDAVAVVRVVSIAIFPGFKLKFKLFVVGVYYLTKTFCNEELLTNNGAGKSLKMFKLLKQTIKITSCIIILPKLP